MLINGILPNLLIACVPDCYWIEVAFPLLYALNPIVWRQTDDNAHLSPVLVSPRFEQSQADLVLLGIQGAVPFYHVHAVIGQAQTLAQHAPLQAQAVTDIPQSVIG